MAITVRCACGKTYRVLDSFAGKPYECPSCRANTIVPGSANQVKAAGPSPAPATKAPRAAQKPTPPPPRVAPPPQPSPRPTATTAPPPPTVITSPRRERSSTLLMGGVGVGACVVVVGSAVVLAPMLSDWWKKKPMEPEPPVATPTKNEHERKDTNEVLSTEIIVERCGPSVGASKGD